MDNKNTKTMSKLYFAIPVIIGIVSGVFLTISLSEPESNSELLLTKSKLIENGSPILGNSNAPITILEWGDYQCTFCYRFHETTLLVLKEDYIDTGKIKMIFKDFPLNGHDSVLAAEASYCANDQGKYWEYHNELYKNWGGERTGWITKYTLTAFANTIGLDSDKFTSCLDEHRHKEKVDQLYQFGKSIGVDATPSFLVFNDEKIIKIRGNQPLEVFIQTIETLS